MRKIWSAIAIVLVIGGGIAAGLIWLTLSEGPEEDGDEEPIVIEYMLHSQQSLDFYENASVEFEKEYPSIDLEFIFMDEKDYKTALPLLFESGQAPDIFYLILESPLGNA